MDRHLTSLRPISKGAVFRCFDHLEPEMRALRPHTVRPGGRRTTPGRTLINLVSRRGRMTLMASHGKRSQDRLNHGNKKNKGACRFPQGNRSVCENRGRARGWCGPEKGVEGRRRPVNKLRSASATPRITDRACLRQGGYSKWSRMSIEKPAPGRSGTAKRAIKSCMAPLGWRAEAISVPTSDRWARRASQGGPKTSGVRGSQPDWGMATGGISAVHADTRPEARRSFSRPGSCRPRSRPWPAGAAPRSRPGLHRGQGSAFPA
jgi:hypothetical protein